MNRLQEILKRKAEIRTSLEGNEKVDLAALETELRELDEEQKEIETRQRLIKEAGEINQGTAIETRTIETFSSNPEQRDSEVVEAEKRGKDLIENRSVTVASGDLLLANHQASDIKGTFNEVSTLVDRVKHVPLQGGESYERAYEKGTGEGGYTGEGADYTESDVQFGYATINKTKITAYSEESEEVQKLPAANYSRVIVGGVNKSLRKKITKEILIGDGGAGHLVGIFSAQATAIDPTTDLEISTIDADTLDEIIFSYGGDEDVEDTSVLILSKKDLKAFATLRDGQDKKVYDVKTNGNTGTIDGVPYIINSACKAVSDTATTSGSYVLAYGPLSNYELATFSPTDIQRSTDFKFKQGMIAHRGSVFVGGNVAAHNGFLRVKKAPTV
ncbi:HK97 family phage major capsid protein [Lysinibacillus composti]|uniref:Phage major capsid protein n=1 Tax=Lysinibacillus composti TaxID=720633 RepID=A0A3N9UIU8_9BACI|nr:phage major capsid protein [Lysinibacillus composti]MBM7607568.1 HK97 family phage major capsid protein [Lysinibacillus composti]RQW75927.1 phage major capsid protein [Lysinibacillus composti]